MSERPSAEEIVRQLKQAKVEFVINVPDRTTAAIVDLAAQEPSMKVIRVCKEDEGVSIKEESPPETLSPRTSAPY
jgi:sulfopyruvate decarboxylase TPP-binding subunit